MSKKNEKKNQDIIDSFDYLSNAASNMGLHRTDPCKSFRARRVRSL